MKRKSLLLLAVAFLISGCVATQYEKTIAVTKDANGKIVSTVLTERVIQPNGQGYPVKFEYLHGVQTN
jgi:hypothetical protein